MAKSRCWMVGLAIAICGGGMAWADDEPDSLLAGKLISVKPGKLVRFVAKGTIPLPTAANDPTVTGASLTVSDTSAGGAGADTYALPAAGWEALGNPAGSQGFRFKGGPADPCRTVLLKPNLVKAICKGTAVTLAPPFAGEVAVVVTAGASKRYCASFGGTDVKNDAGLTKRKIAPAPASCPSANLGSRTCTFDNATSVIGFPSALVPAASADGTITLSCGAPGVDGAAPCTCDVGTVAPIIFPSIGELCITAAAACPSGEIDCDGGDALGIDLVADHDVGGCASNAGCAATCGTVCSGLGATYEVRASGCEGFCVGGANDDTACTTDTQCPGGSCNGTPGTLGSVVHAGRCNCQCGGGALGSAAPAGTLTCNLGVRFSFEPGANGICGNGTVAIDSGPRCMPLTAATSTAVLNDAGDTPGQTIPAGGVETSIGTPLTCASYSAGSLTGLKLVGSFGLFDQVTGDILSRNSFVCQ